MSNADLIKRCRSGAEIYQEGLDDDDIGAALLDAAAALEAQEWRTDMENAPKDGARVYLAGGQMYCEEIGEDIHSPVSAAWRDNRWLVVGIEDGYVWATYDMPTAWKPLDSPPNT